VIEMLIKQILLILLCIAGFALGAYFVIDIVRMIVAGRKR